MQLLPVITDSQLQDMTTLPDHTQPRSSASIFDRLYAKSTESSRSRKSATSRETGNADNIPTLESLNSNERHPRRRHLRTALKSKSNILPSQNRSSDVFNRLYSKGTESCNSKRKFCTMQSQIKAYGDENETLSLK